MSQEKMQIIDSMVTTGEHCVLATIDGNTPYTSLMSYFSDHAAMKFYFFSRKDSKKSRNIKSNPHVSLLIDDRANNRALSIEGLYSPIKKKQTAQAITKLYLLKNPHMKEFATHEDTELLRVQGLSAILVDGFSDVFSTKLKKS